MYLCWLALLDARQFERIFGTGGVNSYAEYFCTTIT